MSAPAAVMSGYALFAIAGVVAVVSPRKQCEHRIAEMVLLGPFVVAIAMLALSVLDVRCTRWTVSATVVGAALTRVGISRWRASRAVAGHDARAPGCGRGPLLLALVAASLAAASAIVEPIASSDPVAIYAPAAAQYAGHGRIDPTLLHGMNEVSHPDYPPLFVAELAWLYVCAGRFDPWIGKLLGPWFLLGFVLEIATIAARMGVTRSRTWIAAIALLPAMLSAASNGFADVIVTAYLAGFVAALLEVSRGEEPCRRSLARVALYGAAAALTKNEGFAVAATFLALASVLRTSLGTRGARRNLLVAALPMVILSSTWWLVARRAGFSNDLVSGVGHVSPMTAVGRLPAVFSAIASAATIPNASTAWILQWGLLPWAVVAATLFVLRDVVRRRRLPLEHALAPGHVLLYVVILCFTPRDFHWHLATAADRILLHCTPAFMVFLLSSSATRAEPAGSVHVIRRDPSQPP